MEKRTGCGCSPLFWILLILALALFLLIEVRVNHWKLSLPVHTVTNSSQAAAASLPQAQTPAPFSSYVVLGQPSISADFINAVLKAYHSPAAGTGQALYDLGVRYGIDPVFALAFFQHESQFGTQGEARASRSLGNIRCLPRLPCRDGYAWFRSWQQGFLVWYQLIHTGYVAHGLTNLSQIIPVYAPPGDGNNVAAYVAAVEHDVDTWRKGQVQL